MVWERESFECISEAEAEGLLRKDVATAKEAVLRLIQVPLTECQFDALTSFVYNLGAGALQLSTLRRKVNRETRREVPAEFMRWVWAGGRKLKGLLRRRQAEAICYTANISPNLSVTPCPNLPQ